jgi:hypothetical protein
MSCLSRHAASTHFVSPAKGFPHQPITGDTLLRHRAELRPRGDSPVRPSHLTQVRGLSSPGLSSPAQPPPSGVWCVSAADRRGTPRSCAATAPSTSGRRCGRSGLATAPAPRHRYGTARVRCASIFHKERPQEQTINIGKSQSKRKPNRTQRTPHHRRRHRRRRRRAVRATRERAISGRRHRALVGAFTRLWSRVIDGPFLRGLSTWCIGALSGRRRRRRNGRRPNHDAVAPHPGAIAPDQVVPVRAFPSSNS